MWSVTFVDGHCARHVRRDNLGRHAPVVGLVGARHRGGEVSLTGTSATATPIRNTFLGGFVNRAGLSK